MKRALLIAGGTLGGLGAVLAITPPQLSSTSTVGANPGSSIPSATKAPAATKAPSAGKPSAATTPKKNTKPTAAPTTPAAPATTGGSKNVNGTFTGSAVDVGYGTVQVKITVVNGKITDAQAVQAPSGRNDRYTNMSVPVLRQRTLTAQSANINGVSGASYTSFGWYTSLVVALKQAGL
ncbi:FMN-binding [Candidatus Nanopelagicaceae bacterium]